MTTAAGATSSSPVVIVTGASGGVGAGIARCCGEAGWTVWIAARREALGREVADEVAARGGIGHFVACDVSDETSVAQAVDTVLATSGRLDGVAHNASSGLSPVPGTLAGLPIAEFRDHVAVSLRGSYLMARTCFDALAATGGSVVLLTSEAGYEGKARLPGYAAVKAAQRGLVRSLAREWGPSGVRINGVGPLNRSPAMVEAMAKDPTMEARVMGRIPLGRLGDATSDIGPVVRFLLSPDARYLTGSTLMADGGSHVAS